jgi:hypothetical protein
LGGFHLLIGKLWIEKKKSFVPANSFVLLPTGKKNIRKKETKMENKFLIFKMNNPLKEFTIYIWAILSSSTSWKLILDPMLYRTFVCGSSHLEKVYSGKGYPQKFIMQLVQPPCLFFPSFWIPYHPLASSPLMVGTTRD